jgi:hypothetical protein
VMFKSKNIIVERAHLSSIPTFAKNYIKFPFLIFEVVTMGVIKHIIRLC